MLEKRGHWRPDVVRPYVGKNMGIARSQALFSVLS